MSTPFKMKGHSLPGPNQASKANNKEEKEDKLSVVISKDGSEMTRTKGNQSASFVKNPKYNPKSGSPSNQSIPQWIPKEN
tara:strand:+ start:287 stop:526 length:240 start_codon:yes stop_codon:yes gene_type:complete